MRVLAGLAALAAVLSAVPATAAAELTPAQFEGETLNLAESWGDAEACHVDQSLAVTCFRSEAAMDAWLAEQRVAKAETGGPAPAGLSCSGYLRLYDGTSYTGTVLNLSTRQTILNLSSFGFDQRTSSFKVGSCAATFYDYANAGGAVYPTSLTQAYDQSASMYSGWNNDVSSVIIS